MRDLGRHPLEQVVFRWNYKSALTSALLRGGLFFAANLSNGPEAAQAALVTELTLRLVTSGFIGALTQAFGRVEPARVGLMAAVLVLPALGHAVEFVTHRWRGTVNLGWSIALSIGLTILSTAFTLFAMRRGVLVVGEGTGRSLGEDLKAIPALVCAFVRCGGGWR